MSPNKYRPHVWVIPEDDANRQLANGFILCPQVRSIALGISKPAGGWRRAVEVFLSDYVPYLSEFPEARVVLLIDFDKDDARRGQIELEIPDELRSRAYVIGSLDEPEELRRALGLSLEDIGEALAQECFSGALTLWNHPHLSHNRGELARLLEAVRPILFPDA